jgi:hypothetical protein
MTKEDTKTVNVIHKNGPAGGMFLVTYIGAATYFVQRADGFWEVVVALIKAIVWPGFLIHRVFELLRI